MDIALQIIDFLWRNQEKAFTINEIAKQLNGTYSHINRVVLRLVKEHIVFKKTVGHAFQCSLNKQSEKTKALVLLSEISRKEEYYQKHGKFKLLFDDFLKELPKDVLFVVLFGSYAKGTFTKESDIDLLIVINTKEDITSALRKIITLYGKEISPLLLTKKELQQRKEEPLIKEIIKNHIVISGAEGFIQEFY